MGTWRSWRSFRTPVERSKVQSADFGCLLRFLPPVLCGARLSLRVGSVLWGMSTAPLVFDVLLGDATLAYTSGAPCFARDCPGGFCPLSRGSCPLAPLLCESSRASDLTLRASLAWAFVARFPRSRGVGLHVRHRPHLPLVIKKKIQCCSLASQQMLKGEKNGGQPGSDEDEEVGVSWIVGNAGELAEEEETSELSEGRRDLSRTNPWRAARRVE